MHLYVWKKKQHVPEYNLFPADCKLLAEPFIIKTTKSSKSFYGCQTEVTEEGLANNPTFCLFLWLFRSRDTSGESEVTRLRAGRRSGLGHVHSCQSLSYSKV